MFAHYRLQEDYKKFNAMKTMKQKLLNKPKVKPSLNYEIMKMVFEKGITQLTDKKTRLFHIGQGLNSNGWGKSNKRKFEFEVIFLAHTCYFMKMFKFERFRRRDYPVR